MGHLSAQKYHWTFIVGTIISYRKIQVLFTSEAWIPVHYTSRMLLYKFVSWGEAIITFKTA